MTGYINTKNTGSDAEVFRPEAYPAGIPICDSF